MPTLSSVLVKFVLLATELSLKIYLNTLITFEKGHEDSIKELESMVCAFTPYMSSKPKDFNCEAHSQEDQVLDSMCAENQIH